MKFIDHIDVERLSGMTWAQFRRLLSEHFDVEELRTLCFDLNIDYDALRGDGKDARVRELAALFKRNGRFPELIEALTAFRPQVVWPDTIPSGWADRSSIGQGRMLWYSLGTIIILAAGAMLTRQLFKPDNDPQIPATSPSDSIDEAHRLSLETPIILTEPATAVMTAVPFESQETAVSVSGQILFSRYLIDQRSQAEICIWTAVTDQVDCLKRAGFFPVWSPDGTQIIFTQQGANGQSEIYKMAADGSDLQKLPIPDSYQNPREPDWSPDGNSLIFMAGDADLYALSLRDNQLSQVTTNPNYDFNPDWNSSTSSKILFVSWYGEPLTQGIYAISIDTSTPENSRQLLFNTTSTLETLGKPVWSPDESQFVFIYERTQTEICIMQTAVGSEPDCYEAAADSQGITWSPDGRFIAYTGQNDTGSQILMLDLSMGENSLLLDQASYHIAGLSWKP